MENKPICKIDNDGTKRWKLNGLYHREDGPAIEFVDGNKRWYKHGKLHRKDGPAIEYQNGTKQWQFNGHLHRFDGPAIEYSDGTNLWWINGKNIDDKIKKWSMENDIDLDHLTKDDILLIKLVWADYGK